MRLGKIRVRPTLRLGLSDNSMSGNSKGRSVRIDGTAPRASWPTSARAIAVQADMSKCVRQRFELLNPEARGERWALGTQFSSQKGVDFCGEGSVTVAGPR